MFFFLNFEDFWRKSQKGGKLENLGKNGLLCRSVDLRQGMGYPCRSEVEVPKWHPSGTPWRSIAASRRSYCSHQAFFGFLFLNTSYSYTNSLRTLTND